MKHLALSAYKYMQISVWCSTSALHKMVAGYHIKSMNMIKSIQCYDDIRQNLVLAFIYKINDHCDLNIIIKCKVERNKLEKERFCT